MIDLDPKLKLKLSKIKLLSVDVDGTLTDGGLYYANSGEEMKKFNVKDGQGLRLLLQAGIEVAIISASASKSTLHRAKHLGISKVFLGVEDKLDRLQKLCQQLSLDLQKVGHIGDDINDLPVMKIVGCPMTVADANIENKKCAVYTSKLSGGNGAVREICDLILLSQRK